jgi:hypothetical protein
MIGYMVLINGRLVKEFGSIAAARIFVGNLSMNALVQIIDNADNTCVYSYQSEIWYE